MTTAVAPQQSKPVPWWLILIEGILAIILGIMFFVQPVMTAMAVTQVIAIFWLIDGIFKIISIFFNRSQWGWKLIAGVIGIVAGLFLLGEGFWAALLLGASFTFVLGILGIVYGVINIINFFQGGGWGAIIWGVLSIIFGFILVTNILAGTATLPFVLGAFLIAGGIVAIITAFRVK